MASNKTKFSVQYKCGCFEVLNESVHRKLLEIEFAQSIRCPQCIKDNGRAKMLREMGKLAIISASRNVVESFPPEVLNEAISAKIAESSLLIGEIAVGGSIGSNPVATAYAKFADIPILELARSCREYQVFSKAKIFIGLFDAESIGTKRLLGVATTKGLEVVKINFGNLST
jgi:hypothetical protein